MIYCRLVHYHYMHLFYQGVPINLAVYVPADVQSCVVSYAVSLRTCHVVFDHADQAVLQGPCFKDPLY